MLLARDGGSPVHRFSFLWNVGTWGTLYEDFGFENTQLDCISNIIAKIWEACSKLKKWKHYFASQMAGLVGFAGEMPFH
jgi:hypothetical protein